MYILFTTVIFDICCNMRATQLILRHELDTSLLCNYSCELNILYNVWHLKTDCLITRK